MRYRRRLVSKFGFLFIFLFFLRYMVTEFLEYGDLKAVLLKLKMKHVELRPDEQIHVCQCIAAGMLRQKATQNSEFH